MGECLVSKWEDKIGDSMEKKPEERVTIGKHAAAVEAQTFAPLIILLLRPLLADGCNFVLDYVAAYASLLSSSPGGIDSISQDVIVSSLELLTDALVRLGCIV